MTLLCDMFRRAVWEKGKIGILGVDIRDIDGAGRGTNQLGILQFKHDTILKKLIDDFIKQTYVIIDFLNATGKDYEHADKVLPKFANFLRQTQFNSTLGVDFANVLQLSNTKNNFDQYKLSDVSRLFTCILQLQDVNKDAHVEASRFEWAVMDDKDKATLIANEGIQKAKEKIEELQRLLDTINAN